MPGPNLSALASSLLHKLQVLDRTESAAGPDLDKAVEKLEAAHAVFAAERLVRWTIEEVPPGAQEAYLFMAGALGADDFASAVNVSTWPSIGMRMLQSFVHLPRSGPRELLDY